MKIRCSIIVLAILLQSTFLFAAPPEVKNEKKRLRDSESDESNKKKQKTELLLEQELTIIKNTQKYLSDVGIIIDINDEIFTYGEDIADYHPKIWTNHFELVIESLSKVKKEDLPKITYYTKKIIGERNWGGAEYAKIIEALAAMDINNLNDAFVEMINKLPYEGPNEIFFEGINEQLLEMTNKPIREKFVNTYYKYIKIFGLIPQDKYEHIINNKELDLSIVLYNKSIEEQQEILSYVSSLTWLKSLNLSNNGITSIPDEMNNLIHLTDINLSNNKITSLPEEIEDIIFKTTAEKISAYGIELDYDSIVNNKKLKLPEALNEKTYQEQHEILSYISNFIWLEKLSIKYTNIKSLPEAIGNLINLKELNLEGNGLESLPETIGNLTNLMRLILYENALESLPKTIGNLTNLEDLYLSRNGFESLPETIGNLTKLETLHIFGNALSSLPETIENLINLKDFQLYENNFSSLPEAIGKLIKLETLHIEENKLTSLPETIGNLINLRTLEAFENEFTSIPASIRNIPTLTILDLHDNPYLLPRSDNPLQWGKTELRAHFGNRVIFDEQSIIAMPGSTTKEEVYSALDENFLRINRDIFVSNKLPDIQVEKIFEGEEMLETLTQIVTSINFKKDKEPGYLSYEMLANDFASDAQNQNLSNIEKVWQYVMPRLTGYIRTLYDLPLEGNDIKAWNMYDAQIPETQKALTFIMERIKNTFDPDAKMLLFNLLVNGLLHCPTGQAEGINSVAYALSEGGYQTNNFKDNLKRFLAIKKNANFTTAILAKAAENSQNVHLISAYRDELKEELGLTSAIATYQEHMGASGQDPFRSNKWNVVQVFYDIVSPNRLIDWVMQASETKQDREDDLNLRKIGSQNLPAVEREKETNRLRSKTRENKQFRPFTTGAIAEYLYTQKLISDDEKDENWKKYFTADPLMDDFAVLTREGAKSILIHEGFFIEEPKNEQMVIDNNIISN